MSEELLILDGSAYIFRAYYGVQQNLTNKDGFPTNAIFGFKNMMNTLLVSEKPTHVVVVFDAKGKSFRNDIYPEYKANRGAPPEDLKLQFEPIFKFVELLNLKTLSIEGFEADDIIGSLVHKFKDKIQVKIISADKDLAQLITDQVIMYDPMRGNTFDREYVHQKFGVYPDKIVEYLALMGDASDNIPGAKGVGAKTAAKLLDEFESIENLLKSTDLLKGALKTKIEDSIENIELSLKLTQIKCDMELDCSVDDFIFKTPDLQKLGEFYQEYSFKQDNFFKGETVEVSAPKKESPITRDNYELVTAKSRFEEIVDIIFEKKLAAIDFETTSLEAVEADLVGISLAWEGGNPVYIPVGHEKAEKQLDLKDAVNLLRKICENKDLTLVGQNIKYELLILKNYDIEVAARIEDTLIMSFLIDSSTRKHSLDHLAETLLGHQMIKYEDVCGKGKSQILFSKVPLDKALEYAAEDAEATFLIYKNLKDKLPEKELDSLYYDLEIPVCRVLANMEIEGVSLDADYLKTLSESFHKDLESIIDKIYEIAGEEFNINSTQQLGKILFDKLGITTGKKKTKTGYSTDHSVLEKIAEEEEIGKLLLEHRTKTKLLNTYVDVLPNEVSKNTGRIHTSYQQTIAATGRLSSIKPNLQNIPIRGEDGNKVRRAFVPNEGFKLLSADYSQIELRVLAHLANDPGLQEAFRSGDDIHAGTASVMYSVSLEDVTADQRRAAKAINFGVLYGMGAYRLAKEIGVSNSEAKEFIETYFRRFSNVKNYVADTVQFAKENGYVKTMLHRRRYLPDINSKNHMARTGAERVAVNTTIQGSAADIIKKAMINIDAELHSEKWNSKLLLQVHDELIFEVTPEEQNQFTDMVKDKMENAVSLKVPLTVEVGIGNNWQEAH